MSSEELTQIYLEFDGGILNYHCDLNYHLWSNDNVQKSIDYFLETMNYQLFEGRDPVLFTFALLPSGAPGPE